MTQYLLAQGACGRIQILVKHVGYMWLSQVDSGLRSFADPVSHFPHLENTFCTVEMVSNEVIYTILYNPLHDTNHQR